jgi:hypothetical protein
MVVARRCTNSEGGMCRECERLYDIWRACAGLECAGCTSIRVRGERQYRGRRSALECAPFSVHEVVQFVRAEPEKPCLR